ncbi:sterol desaturase family protein [Colwellia sp. UCD-KL20]|uniref:sterol desaturase family protein n=1 Tax=Colwellia sp. UCD-KL20 TaxID=1917165 RepID=UPI000970D3A5|nr:sterol desaturase family protein [Colwellia sp. UCD-KL20]
MTIIDFFTSNLAELASYINDANKRLYWLYLASAVVLAIPVYYLQTKKQKVLNSANDNDKNTIKNTNEEHSKPSNFFTFLFPKKIYLAQSSRIDYQLLIVNKFIKAALFPLIIFTMAPIALSLSSALESILGTRDFLPWSSTTIIAIFTLLLFLVDDFTRFFLHYLLHKIPFLWEFHKVHHSATVLTPFTIYRSHPLENYFYACRMALTQGVVVGICYYYFGPTLKMADILGANVFIFLFNFLGSNLRHSHIWLSFGNPIENWIISPAQHQIHHSTNPKHFDKNFGTALAIWDRIFGSHITAKGEQVLSYGVGKNNPDHSSLIKVYLSPFKALFKK